MPKASSTFHRARLRRAVDGTERRDTSRARSSIPTSAPFGSRAQSLREPSSRYDEALLIPWSRGSRPVMIVVQTGGPSVGRTVASGAHGATAGQLREPGHARRGRVSRDVRGREPVDRDDVHATRGGRRSQPDRGRRRRRTEAGGRSASGTAIETAGTRIASTAANGRSCRGKSATSRPMARNTADAAGQDGGGDGERMDGRDGHRVTVGQEVVPVERGDRRERDEDERR